MSNHLGNVLATVSDRKLSVDSNNDGTVDYYNAEIVSANDYAPFGSLLVARQFKQANANNYRFGFNGKEKDNDINGVNVDYNYGARIYDSRIGKFLSIDPLIKKYPWYTPYQFAGNKPIGCIDIDGLEEFWVTKNKDGTLDVVLHRVDAPFVVIYNGQKLDAFPQQNINDYYQQHVIVKNEPDKNNNNHVTSVEVNDENGSRQYDDNQIGSKDPQLNQPFLMNVPEEKELKFIPVKSLGTSGATILQSNSVDNPKSNSAEAGIANDVEMVSFTYSSLDKAKPSKFTVTDIDAKGNVIATYELSGSSGVGTTSSAILSVDPGSHLNVTVTSDNKNASYSYTVKEYDTTNPEVKNAPIAPPATAPAGTSPPPAAPAASGEDSDE